MDRRNIVVIGGSAGAALVLKRVLAALPPDLAASLFVVTHFPGRTRPSLRDMLAPTSALPVDVAIDGQPIEPGRIYVATADLHLLLRQGVICLGAGPKENMMRPAIDALFRSAALAYGPRVVGLVLSGYLDDGSAGLAAIKARGGVAIVQHPLDAETPDMPRAALAAVEADATPRDDEIAETLVRFARSAAPTGQMPPDPALELEVRIASGARLGAAALGQVAAPSALTCPACHGVLSEVRGGPLRYRCQTGHAFTADSALAAQEAGVDEAMMLALRVMEERVTLVSRMAREAREQGRRAIAELYEGRAEEYGRYAATLREATLRTLIPSAAAQ